MIVNGITPGEFPGSAPIWHLMLTSMNFNCRYPAQCGVSQ